MKRFLATLGILLVVLTGCAPETGIVRSKRIDVHCYAAICNYQPQLWVSDTSSSSWPYTDRPAAGYVDVTDYVYRRCHEGDRYPDCTK